MIPAWRPYFWRWLTHRRENTPKVVLGVIALAMMGEMLRLSQLNAGSLPGFSNDLPAEYAVKLNAILDEEKIKELARSRAEMLTQQAAAEEHIKNSGKVLVASSQFMVLKDNLGY